MPLFKKKTEEEKQARQLAKEEKRLQESLELKELRLEQDIFPHIKSDEFKERLKNIQIELSESIHEKFEQESVIKLEQILQHENEILLGFVSGKSKETLLSADIFVACTTQRVLVLVKGKTGFSGFPFRYLQSLQVSRNEIKDAYALDTITFQVQSKILKVMIYAKVTDKFVGAIEFARYSEIVQRSIMAGDISPRIQSESLLTTIKNLDWRLSLVDSEFLYDAVAKLEHVLSPSETLLGFAMGIDKLGFNKECLLVVTSERVFIISEHAGGKITNSFSYDELNSVKVDVEKNNPKTLSTFSPRVGSITLYTLREEYGLIGLHFQAVEKISDVINKANKSVSGEKTSDEGASTKEEKSVTEQLNELKQLLYSRTITQEQYDAMKAKIAGS